MPTKNKCTTLYWGNIFSSSVYEQTNYLKVLCTEANPRDKLSQYIISFHSFSKKSLQS